MQRALSFEEKYQKIIEKDASFEGIFITAVKTTDIFCRPSCTARKPKIENVIFYDDIEDAIINGYRPCKVCKPMLAADITPDYVLKIFKELEEHPFRKIKDYDLVTRGIEPTKIRRWFKKHYNITFHAYQRMLRINTAFHKINQGERITATAFASGYDSVSGFMSSYQKIFGTSAGNSKGKGVINISRIVTPLGPMFACATQKGICLLEFTNRKMLESEFKDIAHRLNSVILPGKNMHLDQVEDEIKQYFEGSRQGFEVEIDSPGTDFQAEVWTALKTIPFGQTRSYEAQATFLQKPKAVRAVASANGANRISIIIPCHRVIGKDGSLTGYGGGLERKQWLLDFENRLYNV